MPTRRGDQRGWRCNWSSIRRTITINSGISGGRVNTASAAVCYRSILKTGSSGSSTMGPKRGSRAPWCKQGTLRRTSCWLSTHPSRGCVLQVDIKDGKFWIQYDGTETGLACALVQAGVPKEDIVLAFHAPHKRQYTGYAVA